MDSKPTPYYRLDDEVPELQVIDYDGTIIATVSKDGDGWAVELGKDLDVWVVF